ncbi:MAG: hypothetical protein B6241_01920 [Spirochaetaceae bacterium 4572_59]|nr:MAG: hypothetical protein B6241_01920 [Spirochaetaceae bacterium 4572_59]
MKKEFMTELERRKIQRQLFALEDEKEAAEARYKFLIEQAQVGIFRISRSSGEVIEANCETVQMFNCRNFGELQSHLTPSNSGEPRFLDSQQIHNLESGDAVSFSVHTLKKEGESFWVRVILQRLNDMDYLEGIITDISEQVRMDIELRKAIISAENAQREAEGANKAKSDFLANISHEIRTPLNGIIGFTEIIMASIDSPEGHLYAGKILDESENLMTLINQLLDISKIEAKQIQLNNSPYYLRNLLAETISFIRLRARNKGLKLTVDYDERIPPCLLGDSYRIRQILLNLLSNAVKFTDQGSITLKVFQQERRGKDLILRFEVQDTGIGIPDSMHDAIYESFVQADSSISRQYGGTGLGISISKELVKIMGGDIWYKSREDTGSTFFFTVPCQEVEPFDPDHSMENRKKSDSSRLLKGASILIVEDYPTNREIAQHHLESVGCSVDLAYNGCIALEQVKKKQYDLILMDVHMPDINGLEATENIRKLDKYRETPIIGMTANVLSANRDECKKAGMNDFIPKPLRKKDLLDALEYWYTHGPGSTRESAQKESVCEGNLRPSPIFDYLQFLDEMDGDQDIASEIIWGFLDQLDSQLEIIQAAMDGRDWEVLHREVHSIKGGALNIGIVDLEEWALAMERAASDHYEAVMPLLFRNLKDCVSRVRQFCKASIPSTL